MKDQPIEPKSMDIDFNVEEKNVVLIDDVLFTGELSGLLWIL